jgi:hypothetical protein
VITNSSIRQSPGFSSAKVAKFSAFGASPIRNVAADRQTAYDKTTAPFFTLDINPYPDEIDSTLPGSSLNCRPCATNSRHALTERVARSQSWEILSRVSFDLGV